MYEQINLKYLDINDSHCSAGQARHSCLPWNSSKTMIVYKYITLEGQESQDWLVLKHLNTTSLTIWQF